MLGVGVGRSRKRKILGAAVNSREVTKSPLTLAVDPSCSGVLWGLSPSDLPTTDPPSLQLRSNTVTATAPWSSGGRGLSSHQGRSHSPGFERSAALSTSASCPSNFQGHLPPKFLGRARFKDGPGATQATKRHPRPPTCPRPCSPTPGSASCRPGALLRCPPLNQCSGAASPREGLAPPPHCPLQALWLRGIGVSTPGSHCSRPGQAGWEWALGPKRGSARGGASCVPRAPPESGFPGGTLLVPGWGPEPARPPRLHCSGTHFRARVYNTGPDTRRETKAEARGSPRKQDFPPHPQPRVPGKLKIEQNVQIRPAPRDRRSLCTGHCPPPYTLPKDWLQSLNP